MRVGSSSELILLPRLRLGNLGEAGGAFLGGDHVASDIWQQVSLSAIALTLRTIHF